MLNTIEVLDFDDENNKDLNIKTKQERMKEESILKMSG